VRGLKIFTFFLLLVQACLLSGCLYQDRVPHLASDVCLILPEKSTKEDVLSYLGQPAITRREADGSEIWIYYQVEKSLMRKLPLVGAKMGYENYDVVTVSFVEKTVRMCAYRYFNEEQFKQTVKEHGEQPGK